METIKEVWVTEHYALKHLMPKDANGRILTGYGRSCLEKAMYETHKVQWKHDGTLIKIKRESLKNL